jgi:ABC-type multidrug transport system fused ATPase/permease subunit
MSAATFSLFNVFWTMFEFFCFFLWIWLAVMVFSDIFRSHDQSGVAKMLWVIFVILLPYLGVFAYLIFRGGSMHERAAAHAALQRTAFNQFVQQTAGHATTADQLHKLADLRDRGFLTDSEFQDEKVKLLAASDPVGSSH